MAEENSILYYLKKSTEFLEKKGIFNARVDAEWILSDLLDLPRIKLYAKFDNPLSEIEIKTYRERIVERGKRKPVAYITGKKGFHKFDFFVNEHVLIPRPETEELVDYLFKNIHTLYPNLDVNSPLSVWDLCCGSGVIGISLSKLIPEVLVTLSDISPDALDVAKKNGDLLGVSDRCMFFTSDLDLSLPEDQKFDLILANPPYIPLEEKEELLADVLDYEPHLALFVEDFFSFHKKLITSIYNRLNSGGYAMIETHPKYIHNLEALAKETGFQNSKIFLDSSKKERFLFIQ